MTKNLPNLKAQDQANPRPILTKQNEKSSTISDPNLNIMDQILLNHPGLTKEEAERMIEEYGF